MSDKEFVITDAQTHGPGHCTGDDRVVTFYSDNLLDPQRQPT